jgi:site-specific DNA recombinase
LPAPPPGYVWYIPAVDRATQSRATAIKQGVQHGRCAELRRSRSAQRRRPPWQEPLVSDADFAQVQDLFAAKRHRERGIATVKRTRNPYQLRGVMFCGLCQRRMQGSWNHGKPHYRCIYPTEYGLASHTEHPRSVYVREELIVPRLDRWLATAFLPDHIAGTIEAMAEAQKEAPAEQADHEQADARRIIADCDQRLGRHRAALEAGTDPALIASWSAEVSLTRAAAKARLREPGARPARLTPEEIKAIVEALGSILTVIRDADPLDKAQIYANIGLRLTYQPGTNTVAAEARPPATVYEGLCPRADLNPHAPKGTSTSS